MNCHLFLIFHHVSIASPSVNLSISVLTVVNVLYFYIIYFILPYSTPMPSSGIFFLHSSHNMLNLARIAPSLLEYQLLVFSFSISVCASCSVFFWG